MQAKTYLLYCGLLLLIVQSACGPGPALGLGPALDPIVSLIIVGALIVGGYWIVKSTGRSPIAQAITKRISATEESVRGYPHERIEPEKHSPRAEEILRERYARGEIDRKQYLDMMDDPKKK
jgi:hypothetical protein